MKPIRFNRVAAAFDEVTRAARLCQSSGSEHSAEEDSPIDLSDLVASFMEREGAEATDYLEEDDDNDTERESGVTANSEEVDDETRDRLRDLFDKSENYDGERVRLEVEAAMETLKADRTSGRDFKRRLMAFLREKGFDAGLCKSRWEKTPRFPAGSYQYIDIKLPDGTRLIAEPFLAGSFQIARPTTGYSTLLGLFPQVYVGRPEEMMQVVRLMCTATRQSMKSKELAVPPWRKNGYMQAKWFGSYKRTTNRARSGERLPGIGDVRRSVGFESLQGIKYQCREDFASKNLMRVGHLTAAFGGN